MFVVLDFVDRESRCVYVCCTRFRYLRIMVRGLVLVVLAGVHGVERVFSSVVPDCVSLQISMVFVD